MANEITKSIKEQFAERLREAFAKKNRGEAIAVENEMGRLGLTWVGIYSDGFWCNNIAWVFNPFNQYPSAMNIRCDFPWELFA